MQPVKILLIFSGILFLGLGAVGIVIPGLPTTPFLLLSAACFFRSSKRMYEWLLNTKVFGKIIRNFREKKCVSWKMKFMMIGIMAAMITVSVLFLIRSTTAKTIVLSAGAVGTTAILLLPSRPRNRN